MLSTDNKSLTNTISYDSKHQTKLIETDPRNNFFNYSYDSWNRIKTIRTAYDSTYGTPCLEYEYFNNKDERWYCLTNNKVSFDSGDSKTIQTIIETDGLGRVARTSKTALVYDPEEKQYIQGWNTTGSIIYDSLGRTIKEGLTQFVEGASTKDLLKSPINLADYYSSYFYDSQNRKIKTILPDASTSTTNYSIKDHKQIITTTDALNNISEITKDSRNNITSIRKLNKNKELLSESSYVYNDQKELIKVYDATKSEKNSIRAEYDLLGRRISLESKDSGRKEWKFNEINQLEEESDSVLREKNQSIKYYYDSFGRLITKDYPNLEDTSFTYDSTGLLKQRDDSSGSIYYEYGKLNETIKETRILKTQSNYSGYETIEKTFQYKSNYLGQMEEIIYPDEEILKYYYDSAGNVNKLIGTKEEQVFEYVKEIGYNRNEK